MLNIQNPYSLAKFSVVHDALFKKLGSMKVLFWDLEILPHIKFRFPHYYSTNNLKSNKKLKIQCASSKKSFFKFPVNTVFHFAVRERFQCYYIIIVDPVAVCIVCNSVGRREVHSICVQILKKRFAQKNLGQ